MIQDPGLEFLYQAAENLPKFFRVEGSLDQVENPLDNAISSALDQLIQLPPPLYSYRSVALSIITAIATHDALDHITTVGS